MKEKDVERHSVFMNWKTKRQYSQVDLEIQRKPYQNPNGLLAETEKLILKFILNWALAGVAQWTEHQPAHQSIAGSIPSRGTCLGFGPGPQ